MTGGGCLVFGADFLSYDFGPSHPMSPVRVDLTLRLARELGVVGDGCPLPIVDPPTATDDELRMLHTTDYIAAVRAIRSAADIDLEHGLGTSDNPTFTGMHDVSAHIVGASLEAARQVWTGQRLHAVNISGGLHHAMASSASGFCVYNDVALAIAELLRQGANRIAYVDIDVHHGDGVQAGFYEDPRVLTISLHETPQTLFPGTGAVYETGGPGAEGSAINVPLPPGTADAGWLRAFHAIVPDAVRAFAPDVLVTQHGCDSHEQDPLAHLMLSVDGQRAAHVALHDLAHEVCAGRWVATGGGGYAVVDVVPRSWTHLLGIVGGAPVDPDTLVPAAWRSHVSQRYGVGGPQRMTDGRPATYADWSDGYNPDAWLDRTVQQVREASFPFLGLDPWT
jgi:acetoin utilization protein AcuC